MKKHLLLGLMALASTASFAIEKGEYVYSMRGAYNLRGEGAVFVNNESKAYVITSDVKSLNLQDLSEWNATTEGDLTSDLYTYDAETGAIKSTDASASKGMYYKFSAADGSATIVSFKIREVEGKMPWTTNTVVRLNTAENGGNVYGCDAVAGHNYINVIGNNPNSGYKSNEGFESYGSPFTLTSDWQTVNFAIPSGDPKDLYLTISGTQTDVEIKDIQIAGATQMANMKQQAALLAKVNAIINAKDWKGADEGLAEMKASLESVTAEMGAAEFEEIVNNVEETINSFYEDNLEDFIATCGAKTNFSSVKSKTQKVSSMGDWNLPGNSGRWFIIDGMADGEFLHSPHFGGVAGYNRTTSKGVMKKNLAPGTYIFSLEGSEWVFYNGTPMSGGSKNYERNLGLNRGEMTIAIKKADDGETVGETIVSQTVDIPVTDNAEVGSPTGSALVACTITEAGEYEFVFSAHAVIADEEVSYYGASGDGEGRGFNYGGSFAFKNPKIYCQLEGLSQKEITYIDNVKAQITAAADNLQKANEAIASADYIWGKAALQEVIDAKKDKIAEYQAMTDDQILASFDEATYIAGATSENGLLEHEVYTEVVADIIAANKAIDDQNNTLNMLVTPIEGAKGVLTQRLYSKATGKAELQAVIDSAEKLYADMKATDYSEENATALTDKKTEIADAVAQFKTTVPADAITEFVSIDFSNDAVQDAETTQFAIAGNNCSAVFDSYVAESEGTHFQKGVWVNGELLHADKIRVGNGNATIALDITPKSENDIVLVEFDYYFGNLSGKSCGFYIKDENNENIAGLYCSKYNGTADYNPFEINFNDHITGVGSSSAANDKIAEETNKTHFTVVLDYGRKSMYCTTTGNKGTFDTAEIEMTNANPIKQFIFGSNYNNQDRRSFFDDLKITNIAADACDPFVGVNEANAEVVAASAAQKTIVDGNIVIKTANGTFNAAGAQIK